MHYPGDYNILVPGHRDIDYRQRVLDEHGVDTQVLSFTTPGRCTSKPLRSPSNGRGWSTTRLRGWCASGPPGSRRLATLPLNDPAASAIELERAMKDLGLPGAMVFSNVNHVALADERFAPLWKKADELGAVIYIHPTDPGGVEAMLDYWLMPLVGFLMDTTLAASKLVFSGVVERHPRIRWVLTHMGGAIPYLAERLDRGYRAFADCRRNIDRPPSEYLRPSTTIRSTSTVSDAARPRFRRRGPSSRAATIPTRSAIPLMLDTIRGCDAPAVVKEKIFSRNAAELLGS